MGSEVRAAAVSTDGKTIVAAGQSDNTVHVFGRQSNTPIPIALIAGVLAAMVIKAGVVLMKRPKKSRSRRKKSRK